jgi:hypothetical protein
VNNVLQFLLEHEHSTITIDGYACVIGKENYNNILSQKRSDAVKKMFINGGLEAQRIISKGHGEINATDDKMGRDNIKYKDTREYIDARRVDISFVFNGHDAQTIVYETIAPSHNKNLTIDITEYQNKACFREKEKHQKKIMVSSPEYDKPLKKEGVSLAFPVRSNLESWNPAPMQYIWPKVLANEYFVHVHSCRYFSNDKHATVVVNAYPDIKWTLEFKWNHKHPFVYTYGKKLHPHDIETGKKKVIGSEIDRQWSKKFGEMEQSFELSLEAEWDAKAQKMEIGKEFGEKIAKTLRLFNKIKKATDAIAKSPVNGGKITFEIKAPVIAVSAQWSLERIAPESTEIATVIEFGIESKPLIHAQGIIHLWEIFIETAGNGICPGAGKVAIFLNEKLKGSLDISFNVIFDGTINVSGKIKGNTLNIGDTSGKVTIDGEIAITLELKAMAKGDVGFAGFECSLIANAKTSIKSGIGAEISKKGLEGIPTFEFGGIIAKYVVAGTVKTGIFKRTFSKSDECIIVEKNQVVFEKFYFLGPY